MKKPRNGSLYIKSQSKDTNDTFNFQKHNEGCNFQKNNDSCKNKNKKNNYSTNKSKSFYELSVSLIFSLWCLVFLFYSKLGLGHGNGGIIFSIYNLCSIFLCFGFSLFLILIFYLFGFWIWILSKFCILFLWFWLYFLPFSSNSLTPNFHFCISSKPISSICILINISQIS